VPEAKPRRPVAADHPVIVAAVAVLRDLPGVALGVGAIFERAVARGLLAPTAQHTIRARLAAHAATPGAVVVALPKRKGYVLADSAARATASPAGPPARLRAVVLTGSALRDARSRAGKAPAALTRYVNAAGTVPLKAALLTATGAALEWLLRAFPFSSALAEGLREAGGGMRGRACVLAVEERKREARRVVRVRVARRGTGSGRATG
jgi:hypothetical protein